MTRGNDVHEAIHNQVVGMRKAGKKFPEIATQLNIKKDTTRKIWNRHLERNDCENGPRSGRPKALSEGDIRLLKRHLQHDRGTRRQPLAEVIVDLNLSVCPKVLRTVIVEDIGMGHRIQRKRPWLSKE
jgi:transposase